MPRPCEGFTLTSSAFEMDFSSNEISWLKNSMLSMRWSAHPSKMMCVSSPLPQDF